MITTRHMTTELELVRWMLLVLAAMALILAIATALAAADPMTEPRQLPADLAATAKPMLPMPNRPFFPEGRLMRELPPAEAAARLWMTLESHRALCVAEALNGWEQIVLPDATAHWREMAMGCAYLQGGDQERAGRQLLAAQRRMPTNAVVAYFLGLWHLEQAAALGRVPDRLPPGQTVLVAYAPREDRAMFELLAIAEFRQAIARAGEVRLDETLLYSDPQMEEFMSPRVGDLLVALGADNFVGRAHNMLFGLQLDRGELNEAEFHLDQAVASGLAPLYGYRDLTAAYLAVDQNADAIRVAMKDLRVAHPEFIRGCQRLARLAQESAQAVWVW